MKLFSAIQTQWNDFASAINKFTSKLLGREGAYGPSNIFGQIYTVLNGMMQNLMLYIEDAFTEQNVYTAQRKKSIYSLARLSGYEPNLGSAAKCAIKLVYNSESGIESHSIVIPNRTQLLSSQNGLIYNIILPQEVCVFNITKDNTLKHVTVVEGVFETYDIVSEGGELYSFNIPVNGDIDLDFFSLKVNGNLWERVDSLYDMSADSNTYIVRTSLSKGIDVIFGNGQYGHILENGDKISAEYLSHNGEEGNINPDDNIRFTFASNITDTFGNEIDGNTYFNIYLEDRTGITNGTYSETTAHVKEMIGYNSRSLVLADAKNYKIFLNKFSFVGYNRCWSEPGSLVVNALIMRNYKQLCEKGTDYFNLNESDFLISDNQKQSLREAIINSGQQIGGTILNFIDPIIKKYAMFVYIKMKSNVIYDNDLISNQIKNVIGNFFGDIKSDIYIPKSDIIQLIKNEIPQIDGINIYIISHDNEVAKQSGYYYEDKFIYNPSLMTYTKKTIRVDVPKGTDPHLGLDDHGNILLENDMYFPVLMGGWNYSTGLDNDTVMVNDPIQIIFQS